MARVEGRVKLTFDPEVNLAQRLCLRLGLNPPVDVEGLVRRYADLTAARFPMDVDVDGICLDLKIPCKRPRVIINSRKPKNRVRFTLAHELGHILIPWHMGSIVDETDVDENCIDDYWQIENEANRFASELLMPEVWVKGQLQAASNPLVALYNVTEQAIVSVQAATIKIMNMLPEGQIIVQLDGGFVISSMRSPGTLASAPPIGTQVDSDAIFPWAYRWKLGMRGRRFVWWTFPADVPLPAIQTAKEWREILDQMLIDLAPPEIQQFKATLNGIIAFANGSVRKNRTEGAILSACLQRLHSNSTDNLYLEAFLAHDLFDEFIVARIRDFLN